MKPQLADDADLKLIKLPCIIQPKFDGVRALNLTGQLTGRSLDPFSGFRVTEFFSKLPTGGLDGEMVLGKNPLSTERLCSLTSGAMGKFKGVKSMADLHWWVFDDCSVEDTYAERFRSAGLRVKELDNPRVHLVPSDWITTMEQLVNMIEAHLAAGAEGSIIRNPYAMMKEGRPSKEHWEYMRLKLWTDGEILVTKIIEGESNQNEAKKNTLGKSQRSSAKAGKVPNGQVGSLVGILQKSLFHPITKKLLVAKGQEITISRGQMSKEEALFYFENPDQIIGWFAKFKFMPHGMKVAPRMPTFLSKRLKEDM